MKKKVRVYILVRCRAKRYGTAAHTYTKKRTKNITKNTKLKLDRNARRNGNYFCCAKHPQNIILASHNGSGKDGGQNNKKRNQKKKNSDSECGLHEMHFLGANNCFWTQTKIKIKQIGSRNTYIINNHIGPVRLGSAYDTIFIYLFSVFCSVDSLARLRWKAEIRWVLDQTNKFQIYSMNRVRILIWILSECFSAIRPERQESNGKYGAHKAK